MKLARWLQARLRAAYPVPAFDLNTDQISYMQKEAIDRNEAAAIENIRASHRASEAVRRALELMGATTHEKH
jgi:hypothetical protein